MKVPGGAACLLVVALVGCDVADPGFTGPGGDGGRSDANVDATVVSCVGAADCATAPTSVCADATIRRDFIAPGTCAGDVCEFPFTDTVCEHGCRDGACVEPVVRYIEPGFYNTCALLASGVVKCCGIGETNGDGGDLVPDRLTPRPVLTNATSVTLGPTHGCASRTDGTVACWGRNEFLQLGSGSASSPVPVPVPGVTGIIGVSAGNHQTCGWRLAPGGVTCWGANFSGELGNSTPGASTPVDVPGLGASALQVAAGYDFTCALLVGGTVSCWGNNDKGQLGLGFVSPPGPVPPTVVPGLGNVAQITAGHFHACARTNNQVYCWGDNPHGQLGARGPLVSSPALVSEVTDVIDVAAGSIHTCVTTAFGAVACFGNGESGQLGGGTNTSSTAPVTALTEPSPAGLTLGSGTYTTCATTPGGGARCWGMGGRGLLCDGGFTSQPTPVPVVGL